MNKFTNYNLENVYLGVLGSHSALEICQGAKQLGFKNLVICQKGREKTYTKYYKKTDNQGCVDEVIVLDNFRDMLKKEVQNQLKEKNVIFIPHRSFEVYVCQNDYSVLEKHFQVPIFGNKNLLKAEERFEDQNQYYLLEQAGLRYPKQFNSYHDIDCLCLVKVTEAARGFERSFFFVSNPEEYEIKSSQMLREGIITPHALENVVIEEFIVGPIVNFNYFYSPLEKRLELLGTDMRRQTNLDGILRLPACQQMELLKKINPKFEEAGHVACTVLESMLEQIFNMGEKFVDTVKRIYPPGIIGPFALQSAITAGPPRKEAVVFDVSLRVPGSPGIPATPYAEYFWGEKMSVGKRIAQEIKRGIQENKLAELVT